jgi:sirohydrochlorin cobaltochelatase
MSLPDAIILFAHGSRDPLWRAPMEAVATAIKAQHPHTPVHCAYLELCAPDLPTVTTELIANYSISTSEKQVKNFHTIRIVPMFLGMGVHARKDLPDLVAALRAEHPLVNFDVVAPIGEDARVTALLAQMAVS